uniref:Uncharacterized protein n=1 Tax=Opuntia streptacantha TaxID=393608 RepID=A0A7C8Z4D6_OPUST
MKASTILVGSTNEDQVKREWQKLTRIRLKDMINKAVNEYPEKIITWMIDDIHTRLKCMRDNDKEFKKHSKRNKWNKVEGPKVKIGYSQGLISSAMWLNKLVIKSNLLNCLTY